MSKPKTHGESLVAWERLVAALVPHLAFLPNLAKDAGALDEVVERSRRLDRERGECEARLRAINEERRAASREGRDLRNRLAAGLQSAFGHDDLYLLEFGLKPRPRKARRTGLTPLQKAQRAAARAAQRAAEAEAKARRGGKQTPDGLAS